MARLTQLPAARPAEELDAHLRDRLRSALLETAESLGSVLSATIAGSFLSPRADGLFSDIDLVVITDDLNAAIFKKMIQAFSGSVSALLEDRGYEVVVNTTFGPLKLDRPGVVVLHLMIYPLAGHIEHVFQSPFTCYDWQRSEDYTKLSLGEILPIFALQPRHFFSARRGVQEYLADWERGVISYREICFEEGVSRERLHSKPMTNRDRVEFAYHLVKFLLRNLTKLVRRSNICHDEPERLIADFARIFPEDIGFVGVLFEELRRLKDGRQFDDLPDDLNGRLRHFLRLFRSQFQDMFHLRATRHVAFRHAPVVDPSSPPRFYGRTDFLPRIAGELSGALAEEINLVDPRAAYSSPLSRCCSTLERYLAGRTLPIETDERLIEIDYGHCEDMTVDRARQAVPELFRAWENGDDPRFPGGGENAQDVADRVIGFCKDRWKTGTPSSLVCTHNVVLRALLGSTLGVPRSHWHRLTIPHEVPITFVQTAQFGLFADLTPAIERLVFQRFIRNA